MNVRTSLPSLTENGARMKGKCPKCLGKGCAGCAKSTGKKLPPNPKAGKKPSPFAPKKS